MLKSLYGVVRLCICEFRNLAFGFLAEGLVRLDFLSFRFELSRDPVLAFLPPSEKSSPSSSPSSDQLSCDSKSYSNKRQRRGPLLNDVKGDVDRHVDEDEAAAGLMAPFPLAILGLYPANRYTDVEAFLAPAFAGGAGPVRGPPADDLVPIVAVFWILVLPSEDGWRRRAI
jgi:hypothetical protein